MQQTYQAAAIPSSRLAEVIRRRALGAAILGPALAGLAAYVLRSIVSEQPVSQFLWCLFGLAPAAFTFLLSVGFFESWVGAVAWAAGVFGFLTAFCGLGLADALQSPWGATGGILSVSPVCLYGFAAGRNVNDWLWNLAWMGLVLGFLPILAGSYLGTWPARWQLSLGILSLGPGQLFRAAALIQRDCGLRFPSFHGLLMMLVALVTTAWATGLLVAAFGGSAAGESHGFGIFVGIVSLRQLYIRSVLPWRNKPMVSVYERMQKNLLVELIGCLQWSLISVVIASCCGDGSSLLSTEMFVRLLASTLVLLIGSLQVEMLQNTTSLLPSELPKAKELAEAFAEPLCAHGPGLGRWVAMTALAQAAVPHLDKSESSSKGDGGGGGGSSSKPWAAAPAPRSRSTAGQLPPLARELFNPPPFFVDSSAFPTAAPSAPTRFVHGGMPGTDSDQWRAMGRGQLGRGFVSTFPSADAMASSSFQGAPTSAQTLDPFLQGSGTSGAMASSAPLMGQQQDSLSSSLFPGQPPANLALGGSVGGAQAKESLHSPLGGPCSQPPASAGLFALYLRSGLEILRESSVRLLCLAEAPRRRGPASLMPEQLAAQYTGFRDSRCYLEALQVQAVELLPLARVSASGLAAWICISRDSDGAGVIQREDGLRKTIFELSGLLTALERVWCLIGALGLCETNIQLIEDTRTEVLMSIERLLLAFEGKGLGLLKLPPEYAQMLANIASRDR